MICVRILSADSDEEYKYTLIQPNLAKVDFVKIKKKIYDLAINNDDLNNTNNSSSISIIVDIKNKIEIRVPTINLEVFLSNIKKIVLDAKRS